MNNDIDARPVMESPISLLSQVTFSIIAFAVLLYIFVRLVRNAKQGGKGMQALGAAVMLLGFGSPRDPVNEIIEQAKSLSEATRTAPETHRQPKIHFHKLVQEWLLLAASSPAFSRISRLLNVRRREMRTIDHELS